MTSFTESIEVFVDAHLPAEPPDVRDDKIIHDAIWGTVDLRRHEVALLDTPLLQRLRRIHQTSFAYLTYPSAVHTRFEHSLGCLYLASRFTQALRSRGGPTRTLVTDEVEQSIRAAALLHDIGHGPFSHSSEEIYRHLPGLREACRELGIPPQAKPHEALSCLILKSERFRDFIGRINVAYGQSLDVDRMIRSICGVSTPEQQFEADMLNGPFDVDKIDYVMRDGRLIGLPVAVDLARLFTAVDVHSEPETRERKLVLDLSGEITLEQIIFGKMTLFTCVYQHHKARACDCMLKAVFETAADESIKFKDMTMESPVDFLWWTDDMICEEGQRCRRDSSRLHDVMHGLAYRRLVKRALSISKASMHDASPDFLELRFNKTEHKDRQRELAKSIWQLAGEPCDPAFVWLDLPTPPSFTEGKETRVRKPNGDLCKLNDIFGVDQWAEHYDQHKWVGHVFGPPEHLEAVSVAARNVLKDEFQLDIDPTAWPE